MNLKRFNSHYMYKYMYVNNNIDIPDISLNFLTRVSRLFPSFFTF